MADEEKHADIVGDRGSSKWGRFPPLLVLGAIVLAVWLVVMALGLFD